MAEKLIFKAVADILNEIDAIGKTKFNQQQGFKFRGIDDVMNVLHPLLAKHGVFTIPEVVGMQREERQTKSGTSITYAILTIKHHFTATDGSEVVTTTIGEGMDMGDKASNKAMAIAFKYACFQLFCIPTEEMASDDPDATTPQESRKARSIEDIQRTLDTLTTPQQLASLWATLTPSEQAQIKPHFTAAKERMNNGTTNA